MTAHSHGPAAAALVALLQVSLSSCSCVPVGPPQPVEVFVPTDGSCSTFSYARLVDELLVWGPYWAAHVSADGQRLYFVTLPPSELWEGPDNGEWMLWTAQWDDSVASFRDAEPFLDLFHPGLSIRSATLTADELTIFYGTFAYITASRPDRESPFVWSPVENIEIFEKIRDPEQYEGYREIYPLLFASCGVTADGLRILYRPIGLELPVRAVGLYEASRESMSEPFDRIRHHPELAEGFVANERCDGCVLDCAISPDGLTVYYRIIDSSYPEPQPVLSASRASPEEPFSNVRTVLDLRPLVAETSIWSWAYGAPGYPSPDEPGDWSERPVLGPISPDGLTLYLKAEMQDLDFPVMPMCEIETLGWIPCSPPWAMWYATRECASEP